MLSIWVDRRLGLSRVVANGSELPAPWPAWRQPGQARKQPAFTLDHTPSLGKLTRFSGLLQRIVRPNYSYEYADLGS